jgi:geranylgeranyl diphosphate synthase, type II
MHTAIHTHALPIESLQTVDPVQISLRETIEYALEGEGGGFRLKLARMAARACGIDIRALECLAKGIEYFHHASLIFDDLPCMDDAEERRGRRCLHRVAGESKAILAALALVNRAYAALWKLSTDYPQYSKRAARVVERFIGELGILEGQDRDLSFCATLGAKEIKVIAARKTGNLLQLTLLLPAVLTGTSFSECLRLSRMARKWGIAYQILDDFSDYMLRLGKTEKTPFQDLRLNRPNLALALGEVEAFKELQDHLAQGLRQIELLVMMDLKWDFLFYFHSLLSEKEAALQSALSVASV